MRLPYLRAAAPEVLATSRAQRWEPAETLRVLLAEELHGRDEATRQHRRRIAGLPAGKTFASWREADSSIPTTTQHALVSLEWITRWIWYNNHRLHGACQGRPPVEFETLYELGDLISLAA